METSHRSEKTAGCVTHIGTSSTWAKQPPPPQPTMLSLTYRPCLTGCQPLGSDSILSWYAARDCSKTAILPGSDGYKIAGRLWKRKRRTKKPQKITTCLAQRQEKKGYWAHRGATSPYFLLLVLLLGVIDVTDQPIRTREKSIARKKIFFPFKVEASVKAAKFHSYVVGHPIDCKLTVIERDCDLLLGRDMALRCAAHTSHK